MQGRTEDGFYARFLGGFSLYYKEREIKVGMGLRSRPAQCLLLLLKAGDAGVERKELLGLVRRAREARRQGASWEDWGVPEGSVISSLSLTVYPGEILAVLATGAYNYSMASNYNRNPRPPVVLVGEKGDRVIVRRESLEDLIRNDSD